MTAVRQIRSPSKKSGVAVKTGQQTHAHASRAPVPPSAFVPPIPHLQQTVGNRAVQRLARSCPVFPSCCPFGGVCHTCPARAQAHLKIGRPADKYEQEADRLAEAVMRMPEPGVSEDAAISEGVQRPRIQRVCSKCDEELRRHPEEEEGIFQSQKAPGGTLAVTSELEAGLDAVRGGGQPLPEFVRAFFEPRFGYDFSQVRVHTDPRAAASARAVNALAYTVGRDVVFGSGQYAPRTSAGQRLLAHELTHVLQQTQGDRSSLGEIGGSGSPSEKVAGRPVRATADRRLDPNTPVVRDLSIVRGPARVQRLGANPECTVPQRDTIHQAIFNARGWLNKAIPKLGASPLSADVIGVLRRNFGPTYGVPADAALIVGRLRTVYREISTIPFRCRGAADAVCGGVPAPGGYAGAPAAPGAGTHAAVVCANVTLTAGRDWRYQAGVVLHEAFHAAFSGFTAAVDRYSGWHGVSGSTAGYPGGGTDPLLNADSYTTLVMDLS